MHPDISKLVNQKFYQGRLADHDCTNETVPKDFNKTRFGVETNLLFINVFPSEVEILNHPKNETHASVAIGPCK
ncbi:hypothetical protein N7524_012022 [Penicillium chrysogenum]|nr:hypothetical protein N7524_012022 [Penicillium chrysogenum]